MLSSVIENPVMGIVSPLPTTRVAVSTAKAPGRFASPVVPYCNVSAKDSISNNDDTRHVASNTAQISRPVRFSGFNDPRAHGVSNSMDHTGCRFLSETPTEQAGSGMPTGTNQLQLPQVLHSSGLSDCSPGTRFMVTDAATVNTGGTMCTAFASPSTNQPHQIPRKDSTDVSENHYAIMRPQIPSDALDRTTNNLDSPNNDRVPGSLEATFAQCELLRKIISYLFPEIGSEIDKSNLFHSLQSVWAEHEKTCMPTVDNSLDGHRRVLLFWIREQQKRYEIRSKIGNQYANSTLEMVKRVLAINELRTLRLQWKAFGAHCENQYKTPEELLCMTFALMTKTEGMKPLFKEGLDRLIEEESDVLRPGDLTISTITHSEEQHFRKRTPTSQPSFQAAPEERSLRPELD